MKLKAFTLNELLVVLIIIGVLVLLALPNLLPLITKAKSTEAKLQLEHIHMLEETYFYEYSKYTSDINDLDYEQKTLSTNGGDANYKIEIIEASDKSFKARATSVIDFDKDGQINVWEIDQDKKMKEITKD